MHYHLVTDHPLIPLLFSNVGWITAINTQATTVLVILLIILLAFSFAVSGAQVAYFSLTHKDLNMLKTKQQNAYKRIVDLLENPKQLLANLVVANSFANIAIIIIANVVIDELVTFNLVQLAWVQFLIKIVGVAILLLLFSEVLPKVMATQNNIRFARDTGLVIESSGYLFKGLAKRLLRYSDVIEKKLAARNTDNYNLENLDRVIDPDGDSEAAEKEKNILKGIVKFGNITVKQVMKTRVDVNGIDYNTNFGDLVTKVEELHYSRLPVYKENLDDLVGIIHTKELLPYLDQPEDFDWHVLMRQPYFVHEQKLIEDLLEEFQLKRVHFAIVVDEFGGTSGIVTLEDIVEEVIGDIKDEFDEEESFYKKLDDNTYIFEGKTMIFDVCKAMNLSLNTFDVVKGESDSLAGLVLEIAGEIPQENQVIVQGDFEFIVLEIEKNRLQKIKVSIKQSAA
jgi:gliding motility-associated protein GldE